MEVDKDLDAYDPDQPLEVRRQIQRGIRDLEKDMNENSEEYLKTGSTKIIDTLDKLNAHNKEIKQTAEAAIDSKALLSLVDLLHRKVQRLTAGNIGNGVDVDELVAKCKIYMRQGRGIGEDDPEALSGTQRRRRAPARALGSDDEDEDGDEGDMLDWTHFGQYACIPNIRRPAVPGFLLGPLSAQKKVRKVMQRAAPLRIRDLHEVRPEVLRTEDIAKSEKNDLTAICRKISERLSQVKSQAEERVQAVHDDPNSTDDDVERMMEQCGMRSDGGIDLLRFVINPKSFGQTVENMFYVSFLIRDGIVGLEYDDDDLPSLSPVPMEERERIATSRHGTMKHQAVMSMDMKTWREIIEAYNITQPMIEHRKEPTQNGPGARGWYS